MTKTLPLNPSRADTMHPNAQAGSIVCQFSCGAASAVATKLMLTEFGASRPIVIYNAFLLEEHPDNQRFLADCEKWFGRSVTRLRDSKYGASAIEVFRRERYMKGLMGAPCTKLLKRRVLDLHRAPDDTLVFGFTMEEIGRFDAFKARNPEIKVLAPLIDRGLSKSDCKAMIERAGIELPLMYRLGYDNANCIGCVKGGQAYMRAIRQDFPVEFERLCAVEASIGPSAFLFYDRKTGERFPLTALPNGPVRRNDALPHCSFFCDIAEQEIADADDVGIPVAQSGTDDNKPPYPFCLTPQECAGQGQCPRDPCCAE